MLPLPDEVNTLTDLAPALATMVRSLAAQLAPKGIRVNGGKYNDNTCVRLSNMEVNSRPWNHLDASPACDQR